MMVDKLARHPALIVKTEVLQIIVNILHLLRLLLHGGYFLQTFETVLIAPLNTQQLLNLRIVVDR
jgi:hypothetical protein